MVNKYHSYQQNKIIEHFTIVHIYGVTVEDGYTTRVLTHQKEKSSVDDCFLLSLVRIYYGSI